MIGTRSFIRKMTGLGLLGMTVSQEYRGLKIYEVDPMLCLKCDGVMKVISFITDFS